MRELEAALKPTAATGGGSRKEVIADTNYSTLTCTPHASCTARTDSHFRGSCILQRVVYTNLRNTQPIARIIRAGTLRQDREGNAAAAKVLRTPRGPRLPPENKAKHGEWKIFVAAKNEQAFVELKR